jgi:DNA-binding winged helix-turn-helix (wHTH) protein
MTLADSDALPCLLYTNPHDPETTHKFILRTPVTCLGRLTPQQVEPLEAGYLFLDVPTVSVRHARILQTDAGYILENWQARNGVGLYERELQPGEHHQLIHCDTFRIPNREVYVRFRFLAAQNQTYRLPLEIEHMRRKVYVFGERVPLTPLEYRLVAHLQRHDGQVCTYPDLMATLWDKDAKLVDRKAILEVLLHDVRAKLRVASGGFTFLETVRGEGVRLVM